MTKTAIVTGGSSGIGAATVRKLAGDGFRVITGARRLDRLQEVVRGLPDALALRLDVTDPESVKDFVRQAACSEAHVLVNNAGGALGLDTIEDADPERWRAMFEVNVMGTLHMTRALLPALEASGDGLIVNVGSIAGFETYSGGAGYTAAKHAERALTRTLRLELLGRPVRITDLAPGLADTEFSLVRFDGDRERAKSVYSGMTPLSAEDLAECIGWVASLPPHVNIDEMVVRPRDQARATVVHRRQE